MTAGETTVSVESQSATERAESHTGSATNDTEAVRGVGATAAAGVVAAAAAVERAGTESTIREEVMIITNLLSLTDLS